MKYKNKTLTLETLILLFVVVILTITISVGLLDKYLMIPIAVMMLLGIITGFFIDRIILVWLVTIVVFVGIALILNIGSQVSGVIKTLLLVTFPFFSTISVVMRSKFLSRNILINNSKLIMRKMEKKHLVTKTPTQASLRKYYDKIVSKFSDREPLVVLTLISLPYYEQLEYADQNHLFHVLSHISTLLKENRLPSERIFYFGHGEFIIVSLRIKDDEVNSLNLETRQQLDDIYFELNGKKHELRYQFASLKLNQREPLKFDDVLKKLHRKQETDLIDEYLL
jgi:GGDEF domain-containing protein